MGGPLQHRRDVPDAVHLLECAGVGRRLVDVLDDLCIGPLLHAPGQPLHDGEECDEGGEHCDHSHYPEGTVDGSEGGHRDPGEVHRLAEEDHGAGLVEMAEFVERHRLQFVRLEGGDRPVRERHGPQPWIGERVGKVMVDDEHRPHLHP